MSCDRFDTEGLARLEGGEPLDGHFNDCEHCLEARRVYERLQRRLAEQPTHPPPADWQDGVWQAIESAEVVAPSESPGEVAADEPPPLRWWRRPRAVRAAIWAGTLAATLTWMVLRQPAPVPTISVSLDVDLVAGGEGQLRGESAQPGDRLRLRGALGDFDHAELRLYRDDDVLLFACSDDPPCQRLPGEVRVDIVLQTLGSYQPLLVVSDTPLPAATGSFDPDMGALFRSAAQIELGREIQVR